MSLTNAVPFIAGNWKMYMTVAEARELIRDILKAAPDVVGAEIVVIPPFTALHPLSTVLDDGPIRLGAQDVFWEEEGAFTGQISSLMLKDAGCDYVVIGHSERRQHFGETDETVNRKIRAALEIGRAHV